MWLLWQSHIKLYGLQSQVTVIQLYDTLKNIKDSRRIMLYYILMAYNIYSL